mgnify:CR=1
MSSYLRDTTLVADTTEAQEISDVIGPVKHIKAAIFKGIPEKTFLKEKNQPQLRNVHREKIPVKLKKHIESMLKRDIEI